MRSFDFQIVCPRLHSLLFLLFSASRKRRKAQTLSGSWLGSRQRAASLQLQTALPAGLSATGAVTAGQQGSTVPLAMSRCSSVIAPPLRSPKLVCARMYAPYPPKKPTWVAASHSLQQLSQGAGGSLSFTWSLQMPRRQTVFISPLGLGGWGCRHGSRGRECRAGRLGAPPAGPDQCGAVL